MNVISVYRKQAFITSSKLATRHTELHSSTHTHTHTCSHCCSLPNIFSCFYHPSSFGFDDRLLFIFACFPKLLFILLNNLPLFLKLFLVSCLSPKCCITLHQILRVVLHLSPIRVPLEAHRDRQLTAWTNKRCGSVHM